MSQTIKFTYENEDGDEIAVELPAKYVVCHECDGEGKTHLGWTRREQPAYTFEDFEQDPDLREELAQGVYDRPCPTCNGRTTVLEVDHAACKRTAHPLIREAYAAWIARQREDAEFRAMCESERRMGA